MHARIVAAWILLVLSISVSVHLVVQDILSLALRYVVPVVSVLLSNVMSLEWLLCTAAAVFCVLMCTTTDSVVDLDSHVMDIGWRPLWRPFGFKLWDVCLPCILPALVFAISPLSRGRNITSLRLCMSFE